MKIRQGFVSNSSSSSFVAIGYSGDKDNSEIGKIIEGLRTELGDDLYDRIYDEDLYLLDSDECELKDKNSVGIVELIADMDGYDCVEAGEVDSEAIEKAKEKIKQFLGKDINDNIKILYGTRAC